MSPERKAALTDLEACQKALTTFRAVYGSDGGAWHEQRLAKAQARYDAVVAREDAQGLT